MSKICRKVAAQVSAIKSDGGFRSFPAVGPRFHWRNSPCFRGQHRWILTATDFFTKWIESIPTRSASHKVIIGFLEDLITRFGFPNKIVTDNAAAFRSEPLAKFCEQFKIKLIHSTRYYPQGKGLAESSNKSLIRIIKRMLEDNKNAWHSRLKFTLWANQVTTKRSISVSPFQLVYGAEAIFPSHLSIPVAKFLQDCQEEPDDMIKRIHQLVEVQQAREQTVDII
jgi:transposase InsO family protein